MESITNSKADVEVGEQYSLAKILGIWALTAVPMGILSWIVFPLMASDFASDPVATAVTRMILLTVGLIWLFVLSLIIIHQEEGDLRWATIKRRLRLNTPRDPGTGATRRQLWLWLIPFIVASAIWDIAFTASAETIWVSLFPFFGEPPGYSFDAVFASPEIRERLVGAWWFLGLFVVSATFNSILGEEFLFRGILLPRMTGVFGKWIWLMNGVLFGFYHVHQPWGIAGNVVSGALFLALPAWRFRSTWMSIIIHSVQSVFFGFLVLGVVLGLV